MKTVRKISGLMMALTVILAMLAACAPKPQEISPPLTTQSTATMPSQQIATSPNDSIIVIALSEAPTTLDPADHRSRQSETVIRNMFDGLVTRDTRNGVHLQLAEKLNWIDDKTLEIILRQGVKFHDGSLMTADDVVFTFNRVIQENAIEYPEPHTSPRKGLIAPLKSIEKTGEYSAIMHFSAPWPPALQLLVHQQIVPKAYIEKVGTKGFVEHPIGTGPFKFVSTKNSLEEITLERFADYYGGSPDLTPVGPAKINKVIFRVIPEASSRVAALLANEVQIIQSVPSDLVEKIKQKSDVITKTAPGTQPKWIELNVNQPPFDDVRVRQAMNYALDKNLIIREIYSGRAVALPGALSPYNDFVDKSLAPYPFDPDKALQLLGEAGWKDTNGDGILDKDGKTLSFTIDTLEEWRSLSEAIVNLYQGLGIDASVRFWEYNVLKPKLMAGERSAYLDDWGDSAFDPVGHFEAKWHGVVDGQPYGRGNFSGYNNLEVNQLIKQGETTIDVAERQQIYDKAQEIIYQEAPAVFLILPEELEASSTKVLTGNPHRTDGLICTM